jgi:hypothetical protein
MFVDFFLEDTTKQFMQMMRKIEDYFFIIQTRIYQLEIFCSIENKSKYFASM